MKSGFRLYFDGSVQFVDSRVTRPFSFAHSADFHLLPDPPALWTQKYRQAINWSQSIFLDPNKSGKVILQEIQKSGVDFIFLGGDIIDYYNLEPASRIKALCKNHGLPAYYQLGNHDFEDEHSRYISHEYNYPDRIQERRELYNLWGMPDRYYSFERNGVRFISLDTSHYVQINGDYEAYIDDEQTNWLLDQLTFSGPIIIFHHVPFRLPSNEYRLRTVWNGILACLAEDANGRRIRQSIENCPNVMGTFTAHAHMRCEDQLGQTCQFMTGPAHDGEWRYVRIDNSTPPKSLRASGKPLQ